MGAKGYVLLWFVERKDGAVEVCSHDRLRELQANDLVADYRPHKWGSYAEAQEQKERESRG